MAPEDKIRKKKNWFIRSCLWIFKHCKIVTGYDADFKENMKIGVKGKVDF